MQVNTWRFHLVIGQWPVGWAHVRTGPFLPHCVHAFSECQQSLVGFSSGASLKLLTSRSLSGTHFLSSFASAILSMSSFSLCVTFKLAPIPIPVFLGSLSARWRIGTQLTVSPSWLTVLMFVLSQATCKLSMWGLHSPTLSWDCQSPFSFCFPAQSPDWSHIKCRSWCYI